MKILLCIVLFVAGAQATHIRSSVTYAAPYTTYTTKVVPVPAVYAAPLPLAYSTGVHSTVGLGVGGHLIGATYAAPVVYSSPGSSILKKEITLG